MGSSWHRQGKIWQLNLFLSCVKISNYLSVVVFLPIVVYYCFYAWLYITHSVIIFHFLGYTFI